MKLQIGDTQYDYITALRKVSLGDLYDLKVQGGIGKRTVSKAMDLLAEGLTAEEGETPSATADRAEAAQEDERVLQGLIGLLFISKRHAGEKCTWAEVSTFSWGDWHFVAEPGDLPDDEPDPTTALAAEAEQGDSDDDGKNEPPPPLKKSRTSKPRSTAA
jgi:hypothetical protein